MVKSRHQLTLNEEATSILNTVHNKSASTEQAIIFWHANKDVENSSQTNQGYGTEVKIEEMK